MLAKRFNPLAHNFARPRNADVQMEPVADRAVHIRNRAIAGSNDDVNMNQNEVGVAGVGRIGFDNVGAEVE